MAAFVNRFFNNLLSFLPWPYTNKRESGENEENDMGVATPPKRQKLNRGPYGPKVLREMNIQPTITTVRSTATKLQIGEDCFQPRLFTKSSAPWSVKAHLTSDGKSPKQFASPPNARRHAPEVFDLTKEDDRAEDSRRAAVFDLTKEDNRSGDSRRIQVIDLTNSSRPISRARRSLPTLSTRSTPDSLLESSNSSCSDEYLTEDEESSDESNEEINRKRVPPAGSDYKLPFVDLTDPDSRSSSPDKNTTPVTENGSRRSNTLSLKSSSLARDRQRPPFRRLNRTSQGESIPSTPTASVDLTGSSSSRQRKRRAGSTSTFDTSTINLHECLSYGRVLGSVLLAYSGSPPKPNSPPILEGTIDLTVGNDESNAVSVLPSTSQNSRDKNMKTPVIEKSNDNVADISTSTQQGLKKEVARVNSFQQKIKDIPCTQEKWLNNFRKAYEDATKDFCTTGAQFAHEALIWSEVNYKNLDALLQEKIQRHLHITESIIPEPPKEDYPSIVVPLPKFTQEQEARIKAVFVRSPENEVLIKKFNLTITKKDIQTLNNLNWLNDEVINFYMQLLEERGRTKEGYPKVHTFSTFFYTGLQSRGHEGMKRWTKKVNIFEKDIIIVPIHLHVHWCLLVMDLKKEEINYYDSMGNNNDDCLQHMSNYLKSEHKVKVGGDLDLTKWKITNVKNIPQQMNGSDCGIFTCTYAEYSARRAPFSFNQAQMQYFRKKMAYEIITGQLLL